MKRHLKNTICLILIFCVCSPLLAEEDTTVIKTEQIQAGKIVNEEHEIEVYDYHTGTYQTVIVYRKSKAAPANPTANSNTAAPAANVQQVPR